MFRVNFLACKIGAAIIFEKVTLNGNGVGQNSKKRVFSFKMLAEVSQKFGRKRLFSVEMVNVETRNLTNFKYKISTCDFSVTCMKISLLFARWAKLAC